MNAEIVTFPSDYHLGDGKGVMFGDPSLNTKGVILLHEWWGLNEQIENQAEMIATAGDFVVLVPDIYRGNVATNHEEAGHLMTDLDWEGALMDIDGAAKYLLQRGCEKIGVSGFCMGGALAFSAALRVKEISAAAPFYGIPKIEHGDLTRIKIPVQAHFAKKDNIRGFSTPTQYIPLREKMVLSSCPLEFHEYEAGHGFTNPTSPCFNEEIAKIAIARMVFFMNNKLS